MIELEQVLFERDRETNNMQSEIDILQAKLNASEESHAKLAKQSSEMTRRAEESEKWIESHEDMTKELESVREKFEISETRGKNLQTELEESRKTILEMESKIQCLQTESVTSLKRVTTESEGSKGRLNAKILKLSEELQAERKRVQILVSKMESVALGRLHRTIVSIRRSKYEHALQVWKTKTERSKRNLQVFGRVVVRSVQRKRRDMFRRGFEGLTRGIEFAKMNVFVNNLRQEHDEKMCRLESSCTEKLSAMRNAHTIELEKARRDAISARSRVLKESSLQDFREALRLNRNLQIHEDSENQIENRNRTNEKISSLREIIVRESSNRKREKSMLMKKRKQRKRRAKKNDTLSKIVRPEDTMLGSTLLYAQSLASGVQKKNQKNERPKSWKTKLSEYSASTSPSQSSPQIERTRRVRAHIASVERLMIKVRNQGISSGISSNDVNEVLGSTNTLVSHAKRWMKDGDYKSAMRVVREAAARAQAAREAMYVMSSRRYLASVESSLSRMDGTETKKKSKLRALLDETRICLREMSAEKIQERLGLISRIYKELSD